MALTTFNNSGTFNVQTSKFNISNYTQTSTGILNIGLGGSSSDQSGQVNVYNRATLDGTLQLTAVNGFIPTIGNSFQVLTCGSRRGEFSVPDTNYQATYSDTDVTVKVVQSVPDSPPSAPTIMGPADGSTQGIPLTLQFSATDPDAGQSLRYRVELLQNGQVVRTFNQVQNPDSWSKSFYASGEVVTFSGVGIANGVYQWRVEAFDGRLWGPPSATRTFTFNNTLSLCTFVSVPMNPGDDISFTLNVPQAPDLWITIQKKEQPWSCAATLTLNGAVVTSTNGNQSNDILLHVANPQAAQYVLEIVAADGGTAVVRACTDLPQVTAGQEFVGYIQHNEGDDWSQLDVPAGTTQLNFTVETVGNISRLDVWHGALTGTPQWTASQSFNPPVYLSIAHPPAGRYYLHVTDHGQLSGGTQVRQYSILTSASGSTPPAVSGVTPNHGGNSGAVTLTINGDNLDPAATVRLRRAGQPDTIASIVHGTTDHTQLSATFDLIGKVPSVYSVIVTNPSGTVVTFSDAFTIESGGGPDLWVNVVGRSQIRVGRPVTFTIVYGNRGNTNAYMVPLWIGGLPRTAKIDWNGALNAPPLPSGQDAPDTSGIEPTVQLQDGKAYPLIVPVIRAGTQQTLQVTITVDGSEPFSLRTWFTSPLFSYIRFSRPANMRNTRLRDMPLSFAESECQKAVTGTLLSKAAEIILKQIGGDQALCAEAIEQAIGSEIDLLYEVSTSGVEDVQEKPWSFFIMEADILKAALVDPSCLKAAGRLIPYVQIIVAIADVYQGTYDLSYGALACATAAEEDLHPVTTVSASDPNQKLGPMGSGLQHYILGTQPLFYSILFENVATASAAAQEVVVTDHLDPSKVNLNTFTLGSIAIGSHRLQPPAGAQEYVDYVDLRPATNLIVRVQAKLDKQTGIVSWQFDSLDPSTGNPTDDHLLGFLPPNKKPPEGEGSVSFTIQPKTGLANGTQIKNAASIVFDANKPIATNTWLNTIESTSPTSQVLPLPAVEPSAAFTVKWKGTDTGSGLQSYTIYVSQNGKTYTIWQQNTTATSAIFQGQIGSSYAFYSVATDKAGNVETSPKAPDAKTRVASADLVVTQVKTTSPAKVGTQIVYKLTVTNKGPDTATNVTLTDRLPKGVQFVSALATPGHCTQAGGVVTGTIGTLNKGRSAQVTITVTSAVSGILTNTATAHGAEPDATLSNNTATITVSIGTTPTAHGVANASPDTAAPQLTSNLKLSSFGLHTDTNIISLGFGGVINTEEASDAAHYSVEIETASGVSNQGPIESAAYDSVNHLVTLSLPEGTLHIGDRVRVWWSNLHDAQGLVVNGDAGPITAQ